MSEREFYGETDAEVVREARKFSGCTAGETLVTRSGSLHVITREEADRLLAHARRMRVVAAAEVAAALACLCGIFFLLP